VLRIQLTANKRWSRERETKRKRRKTTTKKGSRTKLGGSSLLTFSGCSVGLLFSPKRRTEYRTTPNDAGIRKLVGPPPPPPSERATGETRRRIISLRHSAGHLLSPPPFIYSGFLASASLALSRHLLADSTNGSYPAKPTTLHAKRSAPANLPPLHGGETSPSTSRLIPQASGRWDSWRGGDERVKASGR